MSMRALARDASVSPSHLSRVLSGQRPATPELVERIGTALRVDTSELLAHAALPATTIEALSLPGLRGALGPGDPPPRTLDALRRIHLASVAADVHADLPHAKVPVDPNALAAVVGCQLREGGGEAGPVTLARGPVVTVTPTASRARDRFHAAHGLGHVLLGHPSCDIDSGSDAELDATAVAAFLLVPEGELRDYARSGGTSHDLWDPEGAAFIGNAASRFAVPTWVMARRLAEDGRLAEIAGVDER